MEEGAPYIEGVPRDIPAAQEDTMKIARILIAAIVAFQIIADNIEQPGPQANLQAPAPAAAQAPDAELAAHG